MTAEQEKDLAYIKNPHRWVSLYCPLKKYTNNKMEVCFLVGPEPVVIHGSMFADHPNPRRERFESHEAIIAAGWEVD